LLLNKFFFPTVNTFLSCEDIARQSCAMVPIAIATFEATEAVASVVFTTLASTKTIISTTLNIKYEAHDYIAETHNGNCNRLSSSFKR